MLKTPDNFPQRWNDFLHELAFKYHGAEWMCGPAKRAFLIDEAVRRVIAQWHLSISLPCYLYIDPQGNFTQDVRAEFARLAA